MTIIIINSTCTIRNVEKNKFLLILNEQVPIYTKGQGIERIHICKKNVNNTGNMLVLYKLNL